MTSKAVGTGLACVSGIAFGTYALFAGLAARDGTNANTLLFLRFSIASVVLLAIVLLRKEAFPGREKIPGLVLLGALYVGQSYTYLQCLLHSSPVTASLLLYLYPVFVTIGSIFFLHERLTALKLTALILAVAGSVLIIGPVGSIGWTAILYGISTAICYATYLVLGKRILAGMTPMVSTFIVITTAAFSFAALSLSGGFAFPQSSNGWVGVFGLGIVATVIAIGALFGGLARISPVEASSLSALEPLVTAIIAVLFLNQHLSFGLVAGGLLVLTAVLLLARQSSNVE